MDNPVEKLLNTVITNQENLSRSVDVQARDIADIKQSMIQIVRIEERQANHKEAMTRIGKHVDRHDEELEALKKNISEINVDTGKVGTKLAIIAAGIALLASVAVPMIFGMVARGGG